MNYDNLSIDEAQAKLRNHDEADWSDRTGSEVIEPRDVLYYLDAFGDLSLAINCQGLPKDLPDAVVRELNNYDVLNGWRGTVNEITCPICETDIYEFDWEHDYIYLGEGGGTYREMWILDDPAGWFWDTTGEYEVMCSNCPNRRHTFSPDMNSHRGVKMFFGERDEWWPFSYNSGVVRWDGDWFMDSDSCDPKNLKDKEGELVRPEDVAKAFASSWRERSALMERLGWTEIVPGDVDVTVSGMMRAKSYAEDILEGWASVTPRVNEPTHPDLNFDYIILDGGHLFCPEEKRDVVMHHLEDQVLFDANEVEKLRDHRKMKVEA